LESDCLSRHEFQTYAEAYKRVSEFMDYYNHRRRHGSLKNKAPINANIKLIHLNDKR
jgi:putative transposase